MAPAKEAADSSPATSGLEAIHADRWFSSLDEALQAAILRGSRVVRFCDGQPLYRSGEVPRGWFGLLRGTVRLTSPGEDGREFLVAFVRAGEWFGDIAFLDGARNALDGVAHGGAEVLFLPAPRFHALVVGNDAFAFALLREHTRRLRGMCAALLENSNAPVEVRLARRLCALARSHGLAACASSVLIELHLPQDRMAQWLGVSRQMVNQTMRAWSRAGVVEHRYGRVRILEPQTLRGIAASSA